jgi:hypothetical protein
VCARQRSGYYCLMGIIEIMLASLRGVAFIAVTACNGGVR